MAAAVAAAETGQFSLPTPLRQASRHTQQIVAGGKKKVAGKSGEQKEEAALQLYVVFLNAVVIFFLLSLSLSLSLFLSPPAPALSSFLLLYSFLLCELFNKSENVSV